MLATGNLEGASWAEGAASIWALGKEENVVSMRDPTKASKLGVDETKALKRQ